MLKRLYLPAKNPSLTLSSDQKWLVFCSEPPLPSIELLAQPEEKLAGIRFDPLLRTPSRLDFATNISIKELATGRRHDIELPNGDSFGGIRYIRFNPNPSAAGYEQQFVFASKREEDNKLIVYVCNLTKTVNSDNGSVTYKWQPPQLLDSLNDKYRLNFVKGCAYKFSNDGKRLLCKVVPSNWPEQAPDDTTPILTGPSIQVVTKNARKHRQGRIKIY